MIDSLIRLDNKLFIFINHLPHNISLDLFFGLITAIGYGGIIWFAIAILHLIYKKKGGKKIFTSLLISGITSFLLVEILIKNIVQRLRPQFVIPATIIPFNITRSFSFPSVHATISFAAALILAKKDRKGAPLYYLFAILISFSRIYLGKHYPSDVFIGMILGLVIGYISLSISTKLQAPNHK